MITRRKFMQSALAGSAALLVTNNALMAASKGKSYISGLGVCTSIDNAGQVKKHAYDFVEETVSRFLMPAESDEKFAENLAKLKSAELPVYAVNSFLPASMKCVGPDVNTDAILKYADTAFRRMQQASVEILVFGSGGARKIPDGYDKSKAISEFVAINQKIGAVAAKYKITLVLEPLNYAETNLLNTVEEGIQITNQINHPNIRLLADFYHMLRNGENASSVEKAGKLLKHTHIAEKENRTAPGVAGDDFRPFFAALNKIKYKGKLSVECRWTEMETELPLAYKTIRGQMNS